MYKLNETFTACIALDVNEMMLINGGKSAYDAGRDIGTAIREFCQGFWDGLCGK